MFYIPTPLLSVALSYMDVKCSNSRMFLRSAFIVIPSLLCPGPRIPVSNNVPGAASPLSGLPEVAVCGRESLLIHVTEFPRLTVAGRRIVKYTVAWISRPFDYRYFLIAWHNSTTTSIVIVWKSMFWYRGATSICNRLCKASSVIVRLSCDHCYWCFR